MGKKEYTASNRQIVESHPLNLECDILNNNILTGWNSYAVSIRDQLENHKIRNRNRKKSSPSLSEATVNKNYHSNASSTGAFAKWN